MLHSRNVTVEVNTVFQSLQSVVQSIDPAKLNSVLSAVAESVRGKGEVIGQAITDANNVLLAVNPRMNTVRQDWQLFGQTTKAYSDAAQNIVSILDSFSTTSTTISHNAEALDTLLLSAVGFSNSGINTIGGNQPNLVRAMNILDPTTQLLMKYSPSYTCLFQGAQWFLEHGGRDAIGGNGKSVIMDAALLMGDDPYRYPDNLPIVNATGGPGGKPSCGSLPDVEELPGEVPRHRHRVRHRPRREAESGHRLPRHRQLLPCHQGQSRATPDPLPRRAGAGPAAALFRRTCLRRTGIRPGWNAALSAAAWCAAAERGVSHEGRQRPHTRAGRCCSPHSAWSSPSSS